MKNIALIRKNSPNCEWKRHEQNTQKIIYRSYTAQLLRSIPRMLCTRSIFSLPNESFIIFVYLFDDERIRREENEEKEATEEKSFNFRWQNGKKEILLVFSNFFLSLSFFFRNSQNNFLFAFYFFLYFSSLSPYVQNRIICR